MRLACPLLADLLKLARQQEPDRTQEVLAQVLGKERSTVSKVEQGRLPAYDVLNDWLAECGITGLAEAAIRGIYRLARNAEDPATAAVMPWHDATQRAYTLRYWQPILVPGICQTKAYAYETYRAVGRSHEQAEEAAAARVARQAVLSREDGPTVVIVLDENVLHRFIGSPAVMAEQCGKLLTLPDSVLLHILPAELGASPGLGGPVSLASVSGEADVLLTGSMLEDVVSADPAQVRAASATFERVRAMTGNIMASRTIIERHAERWTA